MQLKKARMRNWNYTLLLFVCPMGMLLPIELSLGQVPSSALPFSNATEQPLLNASARNYGGWIASSETHRDVRVVSDVGANGTSPVIDQKPQTASQVQYASFFQTQGFGELPNFPPALNNSPVPSGSAVPGTGLRRRNDMEGNPASGQVLPQPQQFATGLPFVTPAPGRYPTSPYTGPRNIPIYQNVGYQRAVPGNAFAASANTAPLANLPQYQNPAFQTAQYQTAQHQATPYQLSTFGSNPPPGIYPTGYQQCQVLPPPSLPPDGVPGLSYVPPTIAPNWNPGMYSANNVGFRPLISLGQENFNVVMGRGIVGQPTAYVPGQHIRNFLRYLSP